MPSFTTTFNANIDPGLIKNLGDDITFTAIAGSPLAIKGEFNADYYQTAVGAGAESYGPAVTCNASDVAGVTQGATIIESGITYTVINTQVDGTGLVTLILSLA